MRYFLTLMIVPLNLFSCDFCDYMDEEILRVDTMMSQVFHSPIPNKYDAFVYLCGAKEALEYMKQKIIDEHGHFYQEAK